MKNQNFEENLTAVSCKMWGPKPRNLPWKGKGKGYGTFGFAVRNKIKFAFTK